MLLATGQWTEGSSLHFRYDGEKSVGRWNCRWIAKSCCGHHFESETKINPR
jgi:hypothetical protein